MTRLKPPARAGRVPALHHRGEHAVLTSQAIDELFRSASVFAEGELGAGTEPPTWFGSILITFHLDRVVAACRGLEDPAALDALVEAIEGSVRVRIHAHRLARQQVVQRFPDRDVGTAQLESRFRREGTQLLLDVDLEAPVEVASRHRRAR
ncbi:MAG: hypothetical protein ACFLMY_05960 [Candidatus Brachytrichaceae bacterium NZ_4S206]|jgi:hypothetical protein